MRGITTLLVLALVIFAAYAKTQEQGGTPLFQSGDGKLILIALAAFVVLIGVANWLRLRQQRK